MKVAYHYLRSIQIPHICYVILLLLLSIVPQTYAQADNSSQINLSQSFAHTEHTSEISISQSYAETNNSTYNLQLLKGIPEACFRILAPFEMNFRSQKTDSDNSALNSIQRANVLKDEINSQIQGMLERFDIPLTECTSQSVRSMAIISITVNFIDGKNNDGKTTASVGTTLVDFVRSMHTDEPNKAVLARRQDYSMPLPYDEAVDHTLDEVRLQLYKLASEFRRQNVN